MAYNVYVTRKIPETGLALLRPACNLEINPLDQSLAPAVLLDRVKGRDGVLCTLLDELDESVFRAARGCRVFSLYAAGFDNVDVDAASKHGIKITILPDLLTDPTANLAFTLLLAIARKVVSADHHVKSGGFNGYNPNTFLGKKITGETLGIVGAGKIGRTMARKSMGFDMRILYSDPQPNHSLERELKATRVDLKTLLQESDFVSLHVPYTTSNHHLIGPEELQVMKKDAILINTSRGKVVDESAMVDALKAGSLGGAGLDVYENEPLLARGLDSLENVVLTPHIGSATQDARSKMAIQAAENLIACLSGKIPDTCLNP